MPRPIFTKNRIKLDFLAPVGIDEIVPLPGKLDPGIHVLRQLHRFQIPLIQTEGKRIINVLNLGILPSLSAQKRGEQRLVFDAGVGSFAFYHLKQALDDIQTPFHKLFLLVSAKCATQITKRMKI
jgi:hypothetical protein